MPASEAPAAIERLRTACEAAGEGVTGVYRSASFSFTAPPEGPMAGALAAHARASGAVPLSPGDEPKAEFTLAPGDEALAVYEWCNLHGLWKADVK